MAPAAVQPPEVQFAQRLAANEKRIRDRALKKLRGYIDVRTRRFVCLGEFLHPWVINHSCGVGNASCRSRVRKCWMRRGCALVCWQRPF
uniref:Uncharacterized protein n=1 Tax=Malurus cyaneus samueli TaxID=2593467 RepID=A0A8C5UAV7_9PASS